MKPFTNIQDLILDNIVVVDTAIENPSGIIVESKSIKFINYGLGIFKALSIETEAILIKTYIQIDVKNKENQKINITGKFTVEFFYKIKNLKEYLQFNQVDQTYYMDESLNATILSAAYSTARGIIYTRCLGTALEGVILPIISIQQLLQLSEMAPSEMTVAIPQKNLL